MMEKEACVKIKLDPEVIAEIRMVAKEEAIKEFNYLRALRLLKTVEQLGLTKKESQKMFAEWLLDDYCREAKDRALWHLFIDAERKTNNKNNAELLNDLETMMKRLGLTIKDIQISSEMESA